MVERIHIEEKIKSIAGKDTLCVEKRTQKRDHATKSIEERKIKEKGEREEGAKEKRKRQK